jgi:hypothetical protein
MAATLLVVVVYSDDDDDMVSLLQFDQLGWSGNDKQYRNEEDTSEIWMVILLY